MIKIENEMSQQSTSNRNLYRLKWVSLIMRDFFCKTKIHLPKYFETKRAELKTKADELVFMMQIW